MDESESLDALANVLNVIAEKPYDVSLHAQHIRLAQSLPGMEAEAQSAMEMMTQFLSAGDDVWLPLLQSKEQSVDLDTEEGIQELLALYFRAENDYLSIPILQKHLNFIIERHALYTSGEQLRPEALGDIFTTAWTREAIDEVVRKGLAHLTESYKLWDAQRNWEMEMLEVSDKSEKPALVEHVQKLLLDRLRQPHSNIEETFQSYSSFTTNYLPAQDYESLLVATSKIRGQGLKAFERRERLEAAITQTSNSLDSFNQYIGHERRAKKPDLFVTRGVHERAIAETARRRFAGEPGAEEALRLFWTSYCDAMRIMDFGIELELDIYRRAVRSVPGSGEVWSRYVRFLERLNSSEEVLEGIETVPEAYNKAIDAKLVPSDVEQLVPLVLARGGYEKRLLEADKGDENTLPTLVGVLESGIEMAHQASKTIDAKLRLEKFLASIYENVGLADSVFQVWKAAAEHSKSNYQIWLQYTDALIKHQKFDEARDEFSKVHSKQLDWPEAIWEAWISFEHLHGDLEQINACVDKIETAQYQTNMRRSREAAKAAYEMQILTEAQTSLPVAEAPIPEAPVTETADNAMKIDQQQPEKGTKRSVEEDQSPVTNKKAKIEQKAPPLKRDRENSTVFVADLPQGTADEDLQKLFKDCGQIREIKFTKLESALVATVEFFDRDNVPAALTKDKKRIHGQEISVHLAWKSTLYVTNFPESADDPSMRDLFGKYGIIFEIRWPSKKFKATRRFCYVQYTSPDAAQSALELHGRELEPNLPLNVYVSNPERRKERTDQDANEKEVYVAGLSRYTTKADLEKLFSTYGPVKDVRMALEDSGLARGFAFIEFEEVKDAQNALLANNFELKKRRIAVTLADPRVRARHKSELGLSRVAEVRSRSIRIKNLPPSTQEGLLQQVLEKVAPVKRVEVFLDKREAIVELENPAEAGKLLLRTDPIVFEGKALELIEDVPQPKSSGISQKGEGNTLFKPRRLGPSKPKAGLGFKKEKASPNTRPDDQPSQATLAPSSSSGGKGQDDFRKMLAK